jgi:hypothetical protein
MDARVKPEYDEVGGIRTISHQKNLIPGISPRPIMIAAFLKTLRTADALLGSCGVCLVVGDDPAVC